ncbi:hypothetical protein B0H13DRAFT_2323008 [Mycena leptocephala]|nr:hypothetical protein B0H13DRAFT_2323008 [Mycena leptocephala]
MDNYHANGPWATAHYLMGLGPMPAPSGRDYAVAQMNAGLNSGMFDPAQPGPQYIQPQYSQVAQPQAPREVLNLDVHLPCRVAGNNEAVTKILTFDIKGTIPNDFLDRVCATMGQARNVAQLGWKTCDGKKRDAPNALRDTDDVKQAWKVHEVLLRSTRRMKPVYMEIFDMIKPVEEPVKATAPKTYETAYSDELKIVKDKLKCATHKGPNRWCYISPADGDGGEHIELAFEEISLWAKLMHDNPQVDRECALPPNTLNLDRLREKTRARRIRKEKPTPTTEVHVHQHYDDRVPAKRGHRDVAADSDSDSDDEPSSIPIRQVLADLHEKMPELEIIQYEDVMRSKKIVYAQTVMDFDRKYYVDTIGMADGVVGPFLRHAKKLVRTEKKTRKRARVGGDKENEPVIN